MASSRTGGIVEERSGVYYLTKPKALLELVLASKSWADIGVDQLFGKIRISSTDPNRSNSGFSFAGLVANLLVGEVASLEQVGDQITTIQAVFERMGYKEHSSGKIREGYLNEGTGGKPLVVGYESQMIGFAIKDPELWKRVVGSALRPGGLYPEPTVFSAHAIFSLTEKGDRLVEALQDEESFMTSLGKITAFVDRFAMPIWR